MAVLAVAEYQQIHCGDRFDPATKTITLAQHAALEKFAQDYKRRHKVTILQHGPRRSLLTQNFVGIINLGRDQIEVLPKIDRETSVVRQNLAKMIASVWDLELHAGGAASVKRTQDSILELLIQLFCEQLWHTVRRGMVKRYEHRQDNLTVLRGRLAVAAQIRVNLARPDRFMCDFDEFSENNLLNQVIRTALQILMRVARSARNQRHLAELLFCFQDVDILVPSAIQWHLVSTNRLSQRYSPILSMARLFIEGRSPDVVTGDGVGFALLFDMNVLFEHYIGTLARQVLASPERTVSLQGPKRHLAIYANGSAVFELRPDIVVRNDQTITLIVDTKWKQLQPLAYREGVATADIYQMYAYSSKYAVPDVVLLYPHYDRLGEWMPRRAEYLLNEAGVTAHRRIAVSTIDLSDLKTVPTQLKQIFAMPAHV